ncbi:hypothetical protein PPERSA_03641 [Pseudocohnilembus persalinus]|uniref:Uncharacterized protein n=1 Tax=Pseudocohnilembus persalinus TaxID=266149 RepID=A0A0V0QDZ2_PSEPJ|nr:hypothetical protein PPERSA_03641 [Pseudocohnilembus persalinus]|eukprot:KRX00420.1 hypothetical protein PPERSA_03641 [Pseudocohnilembus persalinus]
MNCANGLRESDAGLLLEKLNKFDKLQSIKLNLRQNELWDGICDIQMYLNKLDLLENLEIDFYDNDIHEIDRQQESYKFEEIKNLKHLSLNFFEQLNQIPIILY